MACERVLYPVALMSHRSSEESLQISSISHVAPPNNRELPPGNPEAVKCGFGKAYDWFWHLGSAMKQGLFSIGRWPCLETHGLESW